MFIVKYMTLSKLWKFSSVNFIFSSLNHISCWHIFLSFALYLRYSNLLIIFYKICGYVLCWPLVILGGWIFRKISLQLNSWKGSFKKSSKSNITFCFNLKDPEFRNELKEKWMVPGCHSLNFFIQSLSKKSGVGVSAALIEKGSMSEGSRFRNR